MAKINYTAVKGSNTMGSKPFYIGIVQHGRVMSKKETYAYCAERTGYKATAIKAAFLAFREFIKENQVAFEDGMTLIMGQWLSVPFILLGIGFLVYARVKKVPAMIVHPEKKKAAPTNYAKSLSK